MLKTVMLFAYNLTLALWVGGITIYTFLLTPAVFRGLERDMASKVVDTMVGGYFMYLLALSIAALLFRFLSARERSTVRFRLSALLILAAVTANLYVGFVLYPEIREVKGRVVSFQSQPKDSGPRKEFRKLHTISAVLNLLLLADGAGLVLIGQKRDRTMRAGR